MYRFPIALPSSLNLVVSQPFHVRAPVDSSKALSIQTTDHIGVDVDCGTPEQTWGQSCVWPFPWQGIVYDSQVDSMFGASLHAHAQIDTVDPSTGIGYSLVYIHLSAVTNTKDPLDNTVVKYNQGDVIGKIGNNGFVTPAPTPAHPLWGSHLHLGLGIKNVGDINYTEVDPQIYFDVNDPFRLPDAKFLFNKDLFFGMYGNDVLQLQKRLLVDNSSAPALFGPRTLAAVKAYQAIHSLPQTGYVGTLTRASLNK